jgi:nucleoside-diphosphate-sugar epimerase
MHCAGKVRGVTQQQFNRINVEGTARLATVAAEQTHPPRFLALSSLAAREPQLSAYANIKKLGEEALASHAGNMLWTAFRPPAIYGPGDREMLPLFKAMAKGMAPMITPANTRFSLLYVQDLVAAMHRWLQQDTHIRGSTNFTMDLRQVMTLRWL